MTMKTTEAANDLTSSSVAADDVDTDGNCVHHPGIKIRRKLSSGGWRVILESCPLCDVRGSTPTKPRRTDGERRRRSSERRSTISTSSSGNTVATDDDSRLSSVQVQICGDDEAANNSDDGEKYDGIRPLHPQLRKLHGPPSSSSGGSVSVPPPPLCKEGSFRSIDDGSIKEGRACDATVASTCSASTMSIMSGTCGSLGPSLGHSNRIPALEGLSGLSSLGGRGGRRSSASTLGGGGGSVVNGVWRYDKDQARVARAPRGSKSLGATPSQGGGGGIWRYSDEQQMSTPLGQSSPSIRGDCKQYTAPILPLSSGPSTRSSSESERRRPPPPSPLSPFASPAPTNYETSTPPLSGKPSTHSSQSRGSRGSGSGLSSSMVSGGSSADDSKIVVCGLRYVNPSTNRRGSYTGQLHPDLQVPHGIGTLRYRDGAITEGEWVKGVLVDTCTEDEDSFEEAWDRNSRGRKVQFSSAPSSGTSSVAPPTSRVAAGHSSSTPSSRKSSPAVKHPLSSRRSSTSSLRSSTSSTQDENGLGRGRSKGSGSRGQAPKEDDITMDVNNVLNKYADLRVGKLLPPCHGDKGSNGSIEGRTPLLCQACDNGLAGPERNLSRRSSNSGGGGGSRKGRQDSSVYSPCSPPSRGSHNFGPVEEDTPVTIPGSSKSEGVYRRSESWRSRASDGPTRHRSKSSNRPGDKGNGKPTPRRKKGPYSARESKE